MSIDEAPIWSCEYFLDRLSLVINGSRSCKMTKFGATVRVM
ncbi:MAG TPA: hypothetical protein PLI53_03405 [Geobacteraceae bacterium]|nr:hypothetical protein [Geobacteraceae bacterium]